MFDPTHREITTTKGPVIATAIVAGTMAAKRTWDLIPFCHPMPIDGCQFRVAMRDLAELQREDIPTGVAIVGTRSSADPPTRALIIECEVRVYHKTGVEMEALTGATIAALAVYDMCKALSHDIVIADTRLVLKRGGKSDIGGPPAT